MAASPSSSAANYDNLINSYEELLIPGLPDDIATLCLVKVPNFYHSSMNRVSLKWRKLVESSSFLSMRKKLGLATISLFLVPKYFINCRSKKETKCLHLDLHSHRSSTPLFHYTENENFREQSVCVALDRQVMLIGGSVSDYASNTSTRCRAVSDVYVLNTLTGEWRRGTNMLNPRYNFAYGVIDNRVYVAAGHCALRRTITECEVYDPVSATWSPIASLPPHKSVIFFFVHGGSLCVILSYTEGGAEGFSYKSSEDQWEPQQWLLDAYHSLPQVPNLYFLQSMAFTGEDVFIYYVDLESAYECNKLGWCSWNLHIHMYDKTYKRWEEVLSFRDQISPYDGLVPCEASPCNVVSQVARFCGFKDQILIMDRLVGAQNEKKAIYDIGLKQHGIVGMVRVSVMCRYNWHVAVLHA